MLDRYEEFLTTKNHESLITIRTGVAADGSFVAREVNAYWDAGAYADISPRFIRMGGCYGPGPVPDTERPRSLTRGLHE